MPAQIQEFVNILSSLRYLDYSAIFSALNTPAIYITLAVGTFLIFFAFVSFRRHLFHTSLSGAGMGFLIGILITLAAEGFLVYKFIGFNSFLTIFQKKDRSLVNETKNTLRVLGETSSCPNLSEYISALSPDKAKIIKLAFCQDLLKEVK